MAFLYHKNLNLTSAVSRKPRGPRFGTIMTIIDFREMMPVEQAGLFDTITTKQN